ncbi:LacI family transcriptional regulator [Psychromonas aquimarina]|uniref:LacI family transcriptional regulator n=1 Tax=Psychromonas aquimarina TaxID=444919 RepID=UPI000423DCA7|nr:LacI family transcriptional regulator [Psychromonas aquimarina]
MAHATLKTLAKHTGLSVTTVSRALKDAPEVKQPTKDIVKAAAEELGYRPNLSGVGLKTGRNFNICAIFPVQKPGDMIGDISTLPLIEGLTNALENTPYHLTVLPMKPGEDPLLSVKYVVDNHIADGVIFNLTKPADERVKYLNEKGFPFITFGQTEMSIEHPYYDIDNYDFAYRAATHLFNQGCRHIKLFISSLDYTYSWHKIYGVRRASLECGFQFDQHKDTAAGYEMEDYQEYTRQLLSQEDAPDGIICSSEISAMVILAGIKSAGKVAGKDVHIVVMETCSLPAYFTPPISGFRQNFHNSGRNLAQMLIRNIEGEAPENLQLVDKPTFYQR